MWCYLGESKVALSTGSTIAFWGWMGSRHMHFYLLNGIQARRPVGRGYRRPTPKPRLLLGQNEVAEELQPISESTELVGFRIPQDTSDLRG